MNSSQKILKQNILILCQSSLQYWQCAKALVTDFFLRLQFVVLTLVIWGVPSISVLKFQNTVIAWELLKMVKEQLTLYQNKMPRTLKGKWARSYAYKRNKEQRGWQKIEDKASHHSHRNMNIGANEIAFTKFDCKFDRRLIANYGGGNVRVHNPADLQYELEGYDWKKETVVEFLLRKIQEQEGASFRNSSDKKRCLAGLKQLDRRGDNKRFVSHGRRFKQLDELN